ncbi:hypothetical protein [Cupriavidus sp. 2MCAB6]|uniref:hypothetical protein n=1 Tax=Cupriavidus sp. 2MCAB6 TaxID=3232981 RepID=UPI003F93A70D
MQPDNLGPRQKVNFKSLNLFVASSFVLAVANAAVGAGALHEMRQDAYARAQEGAANLSLILERDIARNLEIYELSMHSVIDGVKDPASSARRYAASASIRFSISRSAPTRNHSCASAAGARVSCRDSTTAAPGSPGSKSISIWPDTACHPLPSSFVATSLPIARIRTPVGG